MTHTHTNGNWAYTTQEDWDGAQVTDKHGRIIAVCEGCDIPGTSGEVGTDEAKANARLIAAAPSLLNALIAIKTQAELTALTFPNAPGRGDLLTIARIAGDEIAKAEGKA